MNNNINSSKQIRLGAIMSYATILFNILAGLIYTPWMIRQIGPADYGLYTLAFSLISFFAMDFGLGFAVSRFLSKYKATEDYKSAKKFLGITYKLFIGITAVLFIVLTIIFLLIENIYLELTPTEIEKLKVIFVIAGLFIVISFPFKPFDGILIANERFVFLKMTGLLHKIIIVVLIVSALMLGYGLYAVVLVNAFAGLLKVLMKYIYIKRATVTEIDFTHTDKGMLKNVFNFASLSTVTTVSQRFVMTITPTILGAFAGSVQIALFSVGMIIEAYTWTISHALGALFLPKVTKMTTTNSDMKEVEDLLIKVGRLQLFVIGMIITVFASMGQEFMFLWMGQEFNHSYYVALLLIFPGIIIYTQEIAGIALVAVNQIKYRAIASLIVALISIILSVLLSPIYGAIGSAIAIFTGRVVGSGIFRNIIYYKILKINVFRFFKECQLKMLAPLTITTFSGFIMQSVLPVNSLILFMFKAFLLSSFYCILMWFISFNDYEKKLFLSFIKKRTNQGNKYKSKLFDE